MLYLVIFAIFRECTLNNVFHITSFIYFPFSYPILVYELLEGRNYVYIFVSIGQGLAKLLHEL